MTAPAEGNLLRTVVDNLRAEHRPDENCRHELPACCAACERRHPCPTLSALPTDQAIDEWLTSRDQEVAGRAIKADQPAPAQVWDAGRESVGTDLARRVGPDGMRPATTNPYRQEIAEGEDR